MEGCATLLLLGMTGNLSRTSDRVRGAVQFETAMTLNVKLSDCGGSHEAVHSQATEVAG